MKKGRNKGLLDKKRFEWMEEERREYLKGLSIKKSIESFEGLTSASMLNEFKAGFSSDNPVCLKIGLKRWVH
ncbi:MAG: hypothetical protein AB1595_04150 [bacterium]